ncbi:MAG: hypothetical protein ABI645_09395 [Pseudomonadota bacterium]
MKIVLSRKGFDSGYGGIPSPVLPGIGPVSLPIPSKAGESASSYIAADVSLGDLITQLSEGKLGEGTLVHFDPDLDQAGRRRRKGWRPAFGQVGSAQSHLANQGVGISDLFLFFGWFRPAERYQNRWRYVPGAATFHALFGWLQVGAIVDMPSHDAGHVPGWLADHPHVAHAARFAGQSNTIYVGADRLHLGGDCGGDSGGRFNQWSDALRLSADGGNRSVWDVPTWLDPGQGRTPLSYHGRPDRWSRRDGRLYLQTVSKGQEFVLDCRDYPEAIQWVGELIQRHGLRVHEGGVRHS